MVTGTLPFDGADAPSVQYKILNEAPVSPRCLQPDLTPEVETVILRLIEKDPADRFNSAKDVLDHLDHLDGDAHGDRCPLCRHVAEEEDAYCAQCGVALDVAATASAFLGVDTPEGRRWIALDEEGLELGRSLLAPRNAAVSTRHAALRCESGAWRLEDLGAKNGTWVDGQRVLGGHPLGRKAFLQFADVTCVFQERIP